MSDPRDWLESLISEPEPADSADYIDRVLDEAKRRLERRGLPPGVAQDIILDLVRGLIDARVVDPGPAVTGRIEET